MSRAASPTVSLGLEVDDQGKIHLSPEVSPAPSPSLAKRETPEPSADSISLALAPEPSLAETPMAPTVTVAPEATPTTLFLAPSTEATFVCVCLDVDEMGQLRVELREAPPSALEPVERPESAEAVATVQAAMRSKQARDSSRASSPVQGRAEVEAEL